MAAMKAKQALASAAASDPRAILTRRPTRHPIRSEGQVAAAKAKEAQEGFRSIACRLVFFFTSTHGCCE